MPFPKRIIPAILLVLVAPLIAEFLVGDIPVERIYEILFIGPMYGFGALLIREAARQTGRGWPTIIALAFAYGAFEEGIADQSLFNPNFLNQHLLDYGFMPTLGMGAVLTVFILNLHVVWSICTPIGLIELLFAKRRTVPWLGKIGLGISAVLYAAGAAMITLNFLRAFSATLFQYGIAAILILTGLAVAFLAFRPGKTAPPLPGTTPSPWVMGALAFAGTSIAMLLFSHGKTWHVPAAVTVLTILTLDAGALAYIFTSARRKGWSNMHRFALVAGALLTYCWSGFITLASLNGPATIVSHAGLVAAFIALLVFLWLRLRAKSDFSGQFVELSAFGNSTALDTDTRDLN